MPAISATQKSEAKMLNLNIKASLGNIVKLVLKGKSISNAKF